MIENKLYRFQARPFYLFFANLETNRKNVVIEYSLVVILNKRVFWMNQDIFIRSDSL